MTYICIFKSEVAFVTCVILEKILVIIAILPTIF